MHTFILGSLLALIGYTLTPESEQLSPTDTRLAETDLVEVSQSLIVAAKTKEPTDSLTTLLKNVPESTLLTQLSTDNKKKAFWINVYNAYTQIILGKDPDRYKKRNQFFKSKLITVAGRTYSLDEIEHDILRRSKIKLSYGYLNKPFPSAFIKKARVDKVDYRIHFTLNCGAQSCPAVGSYDDEELEKQLELATRVYMKAESEYNAEENEVAVPALLGWFRADFGGKKGMRELLKKLKIVPQDKDPSIKFKKYDWDLFLDNYRNQ